MVDALEDKEIFLSASMDHTVLIWSLPNDDTAPSVLQSISLAGPAFHGCLLSPYDG